MARLYLDSLVTKVTRRKIKSALESLPEGLDQIYDEVMRRIKLQSPRDHAELAIKVLGWIFYAVKPLTVKEIQYALAIEPEDTQLDEDGIPDRDLLVSVCAGMIVINQESDTMSLVHYTAQEYFQRGGKHAFEDVERDIAQTCITYLLFNDFENNCPDDKAQLGRMLQENPLLGYAAQYWGDHARHNSNETTKELVVRFLE